MHDRAFHGSLSIVRFSSSLNPLSLFRVLQLSSHVQFSGLGQACYMPGCRVWAFGTAQYIYIGLQARMQTIFTTVLLPTGAGPTDREYRFSLHVLALWIGWGMLDTVSYISWKLRTSMFFLFCFFSMTAVLICPVLVCTMHYLTRVPVNFCSICTIPRATPGTNELFLVLAVLASTSFFGTYCPVCLTDQKDWFLRTPFFFLESVVVFDSPPLLVLFTFTFLLYWCHFICLPCLQKLPNMSIH